MSAPYQEEPGSNPPAGDSGQGQAPPGGPAYGPPPGGGYAPPPGYGPPPGGPVYGPPTGYPDQDSRNYAMIAHLSGPVLSLFSAGILIFLGPLIVMMIKQDSKWVKDNAVEALNFAILNLIIFFVGFLLTFVFIGIFVLIAAGVAYLVFGIMASVKAYNGEFYRYPYNWRLVK